jgi:hypothetical protein
MTRAAVHPLLALAVGCALSIAACVEPVVPSIEPTTPLATNSLPSEPASVEPTVAASADGRLAGPWQATPIALGDPQIAVVSDACAAAAREQLGEPEANLPTALIDARGGGFATAIFADDLMAVVCFARFGDEGASATVDSVARLTSAVLTPADAGTVTIDEVARLDDVGNDRFVSFGRVDVDANAVNVARQDGADAIASVAEGWWAVWWPSSDRAAGVTALDSAGSAIASAAMPPGELESRVGPAWWWLDPGAKAPTAASTTISALVLERACASGHGPEGRVEPPEMQLTDTTIVITFSVRHRNGGQDCPGHPPGPFTIALPEPLGDRGLFDGSENPPRDASKPVP